MADERLAQARAQIKAKQYQQARRTLTGVDHPTARAWLAKLNEIAPEVPEDDPFAVFDVPAPKPVIQPLPPKPKRKGRTLQYILIGVCLVILVGLAGAGYLWVSGRNAASAILTEIYATARSEPTWTAGPANWYVSTEVPALDDSQTAVIARDADNEITGWLSKSRPILYIRCKRNVIESYIYTGQQVELGAARIRFDKEGLISPDMSKSTSGDSLFFEQGKEIITQMLAHNAMVVGFWPYKAGFVETTFNLRGLSDAIKPVRDACKWK